MGIDWAMGVERMSLRMLFVGVWGEDVDGEAPNEN
jgi:hypothetical protein